MAITAEQKREQHRNYMRRKRANPEYKKKERKVNRELNRRWRSCPEYRERERKHNRENHKRRMQDPEYRNKHNQRGRAIKYKKTPAELEAMYKAQEGKCAICKTPKPMTREDCLHIDHCHESGQVRGWLCNKCNNRLMPYIDNRFHLVLKALKYAGCGFISDSK